MGLPAGYVRKGKPIAYQFDFDAVEMLYELVPTQKSHGRFLSELVRREYLRRQEWEKVRPGLPAPAARTLDLSRYVLGKLCPSRHDYQQTGQSLRRLGNHECFECARARKRASRRARAGLPDLVAVQGLE